MRMRWTLRFAPYQIGHTRIAELGGLRKRSPEVPPELNGFWTNRSFHNYADYALSPDFRARLALLTALVNERSCAIMRAEALSGGAATGGSSPITCCRRAARCST